MRLRALPKNPRLDKNHGLSRGLVGCWPFWNFQGTKNGDIAVRDVSGYGAHGIGTEDISNTSFAHSSGWKINRTDTVAKETIINCGINSQHHVAGHTLVIWFKPDTSVANQRMIFGACDNIFNGGLEWAFDTSPAGTFTLDIAYRAVGGIRGWYTVNVGNDPTEIEHYAIRWVPGTMEAFRGGISQGTAATSTDVPTYNNDTTDIFHGHTNPQFRGDMAEIRLYNYPLDDGAIWYDAKQPFSYYFEDRIFQIKTIAGGGPVVSPVAQVIGL